PARHSHRRAITIEASRILDRCGDHPGARNRRHDSNLQYHECNSVEAASLRAARSNPRILADGKGRPGAKPGRLTVASQLSRFEARNQDTRVDGALWRVEHHPDRSR